MKIYSVYDPEFSSFGRVHEGYDTKKLCDTMMQIPLPEGVAYEPGLESLESLDIYEELRDRAFGGMPMQLGICYGYNTKLNCLEYHRDSEFAVGTHDFILLLAKQENIQNDKLNTDCIMAFRAPAGLVLETYATSLHYAPCHTSAKDGFRVAIILPKGTNTEKPEITPGNTEDTMLWARNKWLLAHPESSEASQGAYIGLTGQNIDICADL